MSTAQNTKSTWSATVRISAALPTVSLAAALGTAVDVVQAGRLVKRDGRALV